MAKQLPPEGKTGTESNDKRLHFILRMPEAGCARKSGWKGKQAYPPHRTEYNDARGAPPIAVAVRGVKRGFQGVGIPQGWPRFRAGKTLD